jgi:hypothetical protein
MKQMKNQILIYTASLFSLFVVQSCSTDDENTDTTKPFIVLISPEEDQHFHPGETINFHAVFSDNVELASYKIEIHHAGDGHTHKNENAEWYFVYTAPISGNQTTYNALHEIEIPMEIAGEAIEVGHYHLGVYLIDASGNEQQHFMEIEIE